MNPNLSGRQFQGSEHQRILDDLAEGTGVEFHGTHVKFRDTGQSVPVARTSVQSLHPPGQHENPDIAAYAHIPTESGRMLFLTAHKYGTHPEQNGVAVNLGKDEGFWHQGGRGVPMTEIPGRIHDLGHQDSPSEKERAENSEYMKRWSDRRGQIDFEITRGEKGQRYDDWARKRSYYDPRSGEVS